MTIFFKSHQIQIYRHRRKGSTHKYGMSATGTVWDADIQPAGTQRQESISGRFGAVFTAFVDVDCDVNEGDQIHVGTKVYSVKGVGVWRNAGLLDHKELLLTSQDADNG
jgi:hypothetical protein